MAANSCGAAVEAHRVGRGVGVLAFEPRSGRKEILFGRNSGAPDGAFGYGALFPTAHAAGYILAPLRG